MKSRLLTLFAASELALQLLNLLIEIVEAGFIYIELLVSFSLRGRVESSINGIEIVVGVLGAELFGLVEAHSVILAFHI